MFENDHTTQDVEVPAWTRYPAILQGIRVFELADDSASFCGKLLVDFGADVIKVEKPRGDSSRPAPDDFFSSLGSPSYLYHNCNKRSITLDFEQAAGLEILVELVSRADVLLESCPPGTLDKLGLAYEVLRDRNPRLVYASVTAFGQTGRYRHWKSCDLVAGACGGQASVTGLPNREPLKLGGTQALYLGSLHAALGIVMALIQRNATGRGDRLDISLQEAVASGLDHVLVRYFSTGAVAARCGSRNWNGLSFIVPCSDGWLQIFPFQQWDTLVDWMNAEDMAGPLSDPLYKEAEYRRTHFEIVEQTISRWTRMHTRAELFETAQLMGFPWAPVCTLPEVLASPQLNERDFFVPLKGVRDSMLQPGPPYLFLTSVASAQRSSSPAPGRENMQVYRDELGFSEAELERLASIGVI